MDPFDPAALARVVPCLSAKLTNASVRVAVRVSDEPGEWTPLDSWERPSWAPDLSGLRWHRLELVVRERAA